MPVPNHRLALARLRLQYARARHNHNLVLAAGLLQMIGRNQRKQRRWWAKSWLLRRPLYGQYETLMVELEREHKEDFKSFIRIEPAMFYKVLQRVGHRIEKSTE